MHKRSLVVASGVVALVGVSSFLLFSSGAEAAARDALVIDGIAHSRVEVQANTYTGSRQASVSVAVDERGDAVVVWDSRRRQNGSDGVYAQRFAADGKRLGDEIQLNLAVRAQQRAPAVAFSAAGQPVVAWHSLDAKGSQCLVRNLADETERSVREQRSGDQTGVSLVRRPKGLLAAWLDTTGSPAGQTRPVVRLLDRHGLGVDQARLVDDSLAGSIAIAAGPNGDFAVAWAAVKADGSANGIAARRFAADGSPQAPSFRVNTTNDSGSIEPRIAVAADGTLAVTWLRQAKGAVAGYDVMLARFAADGRGLGDTVCVAEGGDRWHSGAACAIASDGRTCVAYNRETSPSGETSIFGRFVDTSGTLGREFSLPRHAAGNQTLLIADGRPCLVFGPDDRLYVAWTGDSGNGDNSAANLTILTPTDPYVRPADAVAPMPHDPPTYVAVKSDEVAPASAFMPIGPDYGFRGLSRTGGLTPPDPHLAAGPKSLMMVTNDDVGIFSKDGKKIYSKKLGRATGFWSTVGANNSSFIFDPEVHWDNFAQRFVVFANERNGTKSIFNLAVSKDSNPTGATSFYYYRIDVTSNFGSGIDSPNLGIDKDAYYMAADFYGSARGHRMLIIDKASVLANTTGAPKIRKPVTFSTSTGAIAWGLPVMWGKAPAMYMPYNISSTKIRLYAVTNPLTTPKIQTTDITVPSYGGSLGRLASRGTTRTQTTFGTRFWNCVWRNGSLWACHHVGSPVRARWYEIKTNNWPTSGSPSLVQSGTVNLGNDVSLAFNAITPDEDGNALMVYALGSPRDYLSVARSWRKATDAKGTMRPNQIVQANGAAYTISRWGDYSGAAADPAEKNTIWYVHEYAPTTNVWSTWIGKKVLQPLAADKKTLSASSGGTIEFTLDNPSHANKNYFMVLTCSGTSPGFKIGGLSVPINWDVCSTLALSLANSATLPGWFGKLDKNGIAKAKAIAPKNVAVVGTKFHVAFVQDGASWDFVSNVVEVNVVK